MSHDEILRSYATINALKNNIPKHVEIEEFWVRDFNSAVKRIEELLNSDLSEFMVSNEHIKKSRYSDDSEEGYQHDPGLWCERSVLIYKIDTILTYFTGIQAPEDKKIGFIKP